MIPPQPQQEYTITEHELFLYEANGFFDREEKRDISAVIRSRPHTSIPAYDPIRLNTQPEGCDCRDCQRYQKDECPYPGSNPTIYICNSFLMDVKQHDTATRYATLDKLYDKANQRQMDVETEDGTIIEVIEKGEVLGWIGSLRSEP